MLLPKARCRFWREPAGAWEMDVRSDVTIMCVLSAGVPQLIKMSAEALTLRRSALDSWPLGGALLAGGRVQLWTAGGWGGSALESPRPSRGGSRSGCRFGGVRSGGRHGEGVLAPNQPAASWIYE